MIKQVFCLIFLLNISISSLFAMPAFIGNDYSGEYTCKGHNASVGDYEVRVTLKLNKVTSHDVYGVYDFSTETNNQPTYIGQIMAKGRQFSMTFKLLGKHKNQFSTGMGDFKKNDQNRWIFNSTYYEPDGQGGNFGHDYCALNEQQTLKKAATKKTKPIINDSVKKPDNLSMK